MITNTKSNLKKLIPGFLGCVSVVTILSVPTSSKAMLSRLIRPVMKATKFLSFNSTSTVNRTKSAAYTKARDVFEHTGNNNTSTIKTTDTKPTPGKLKLNLLQKYQEQVEQSNKTTTTGNNTKAHIAPGTVANLKQKFEDISKKNNENK